MKKESVHNAILDAAYHLFSEQGYHKTTLSQIARSANVGVGSVYSYFDSKLHLLYAAYEPWQSGCFEDLEHQLEADAPPRDRLRTLLLGVWRDIPMRNVGLANSLMEALSSADRGAGKPGALLKSTEARLRAMLERVLPAPVAQQADLEVLPNLILMAYDGFVINRHLNDIADLEQAAEVMCRLILGPEG
ncbi:TetR/AcrR family transcriptional regulator [Pseudodonghicola flavimaris]|uniref:TetR/AcrR family transcriptional regulator n=1 Tax=Pseudodonghicola flavimaris TaxID=3050036 RepID=A0ABT7F2F3_9RHOB|nr:TetR/AcrR family transcriptional regulator [Pseudodonghicola flavimaris]MDK3018750.1 TetR/AcrR family transcriptional regulator [Pseudodonghicola flavimaris]